MKKTLLTFIVVLLASTLSMAQDAPNPSDIIDPNNLAQLQTLSKTVRDSLVIKLKENAKAPKKMKVKINGKDRSDEFAGTTAKFMASINQLMIDVLENPEAAVAEKNQQKYNVLQKQLDYDMDRFSAKLDYDEKCQARTQEFESGKYDDAKEKREARRDMKQDLKHYKDDYKEKLKSIKKED